MNLSPAQRGWYLMQLGERALAANRYDQAEAYGSMARGYFSFPSGTDDDSYTVWFTWAPVAGNDLAIDFSLFSVTNPTAAPIDGDIVWDFGDTAYSHAITNKALTSNVVTLTFAAAHDFKVGDVITVKLTTPDASFDGTYTVATVPTATTLTYAKTASNVSSVAAPGTAVQAGGSGSTAVRHVFSARKSFSVKVTVDSAANPAVVYQANVDVPYKV